MPDKEFKEPVVRMLTNLESEREELGRTWTDRKCKREPRKSDTEKVTRKFKEKNIKLNANDSRYLEDTQHKTSKISHQ